MTTHTPGPWMIHNNIGKKSEIGVIADKAPCIIAIMGNQKAWKEEAEANARLIAAAPELLEIVEELGRFITNIENGFQPSTEDTISAFKFIAPQVRAAIAKAEGN